MTERLTDGEWQVCASITEVLTGLKSQDGRFMTPLCLVTPISFRIAKAVKMAGCGPCHDLEHIAAGSPWIATPPVSDTSFSANSFYYLKELPHKNAPAASS